MCFAFWGVVLSLTEGLQKIYETVARADAKITTEQKHDVNGFCKVLKCMRWICLQRRAPPAPAAARWVGPGVLRVTGERMILFHHEMSQMIFDGEMSIYDMLISYMVHDAWWMMYDAHKNYDILGWDMRFHIVRRMMYDVGISWYMICAQII